MVALRSYPDAPPNSLMDSTMSPNVNNTRKNWGTFLSSQHFGGRGVLELQDGTRKIDKQFNYSHKPNNKLVNA